jgi:hypothetical protein
VRVRIRYCVGEPTTVPAVLCMLVDVAVDGANADVPCMHLQEWSYADAVVLG